LPSYIVRTILGVETDNPLSAVDEYKHYMAEHDPDGHVYRVENKDTQEMTYVYRNLAMTLEEIKEYFREDE